MSGSASDSDQSFLRSRGAHSHSHHRPRHHHSSHDDHRAQPDPEPVDGSLGTGHGDDDHGQQLRHREAQPQPQDQAPPQINTDNFVTQVIQTVSLIQYVDPAGNPYETQTFLAPPNTVVIDTVSGITVTISPPNPASLTAAADPAATSVVPGAESAVPVAPFPDDPTVSDSISSAPQPPTTEPPSALPEPSLSVPEPLPSDLPPDLLPAPPVKSETLSVDLSTPLSLSSTSTYPSLIGSLNSTNTATPGVVSSVSIPSNSTLSVLAETNSEISAATSTDSSAPSQTDSESSSRSSTSSQTVIFTSEFSGSTAVATGTSGFGGGVETSGGIPGGTEPTDLAEADPSPPSPGLSTKNKQVIGGVVGSVAGCAMLAMLLLLLLRYRRKKDGHELFGSGLNPNTRAITGGDGDGDGPSGPSMRERSGPFAVTAALTSLNRNALAQPAEPAATGERGFVRVSGKKLPSVLHAGGDGYTDPRESVASGASDYYRGSQEFDPSAAGGGRLALGAPMRPVSGVPIIRTGPGRTAVPVADDNPFADPPPSLNPATLDPVGRSLISQDGSRISRGSGSRFREVI
jgi:hypothetical protein